MTNPLLDITGLPRFAEIHPDHVRPAVETVLKENREAIETLLASGGPFDWDTLAKPLEALEDRLERVWSPVSHLNAVVNSGELRAAHNDCLPLLSEYATELAQDERLYQAWRQLAEGPEYTRLDAAQRKVVDDALRDFRLGGVALPAEQKGRFKALQQELSTLTSQFGDHLLDATKAWNRLVTDEAELAGLPHSARGMLRAAAQREEREGWLITLEFPSYFAVITHADNRALRQEVYHAFTTRASDQGPNAGEFDNSELMERILAIRHELAGLLGFANYAERSLATKMADTPEQVIGFLQELAARSKTRAGEELAAIAQLARERDGVDDLAAWDVAYYAEKLKQERYDISQESLRPYFPAHRVVEGLFATVERLFGIRVRERDGVETWHPDVRFYDVEDADGNHRGGFYLDLFARPDKRGGAWMDECVGRRVTVEGRLQHPVAYLTCNFGGPTGDRPALLTHDEVTTLFHEFGHGLHHMLTRIDHAAVSGISGVPWDAVELPSQFLENWCWEREALALISGHYESGEPLPDELFQRMVAARNFQSGMQMVRQLEFALFDFRIHHEYDPATGGRIQAILDQVRDEVAVVPTPSWNRFQHGFAHIFAGGYAAGYYSYKWAEVLSADAFSRFEEEGIFNPETGRAFLTNILEQGGSRDPMELFVAFRGRRPEIDALLRHSGIAA